MMTPIDVYNVISAYGVASQTSICDVRTQCVMYKMCSQHSVTSVIDFDNVAITYGKVVAGGRPASVDAIAVDRKNSLLMFVEKKTWYQFFEHLTIKQKAKPAEAAMDKLSDYDLQKKYEGTCEICKFVTNDKDLFSYLPHMFVFLTELSEIHPDPTAGFATNLGQLAESGTRIKDSVRQTVIKGMKEHVKSVKCANHRYVYCKDFDSFIANPII